MIAAAGCGALSSLQEGSEAFYKRERIFTPRTENHGVYEKLCEDYVRLYRTLQSSNVSQSFHVSLKSIITG